MTRREVNCSFLAMFAALATTGSAVKMDAETASFAHLTHAQLNNHRGGGIETLIDHPLAKQITKPVIDMITLVMAPGSAGGPHRHTGQVFAYLLEGEIQNQVLPGPLKTYKPGDFFYEAPYQVHKVMRNLSSTNIAKLLIVQVEQQGLPFTIGV